MNNEIKISVIIPMFNVEHVVDRCLQSLLEQRLTGVEYIFIDDCSKDATVLKLSAWIEANKSNENKYSLICHESNQGVAVARNTGLDNAHGKYVYYVDADDYIEPNTLALLYDEAEKYQADIVGCEWMLTFEKNERYMRQADVVMGEALFTKFAKGVMRWNLWLFLVCRSLYEENNLRFIPQMNMGEDLMIMMKIALVANRVQIIHKPLYHYSQTNSVSLTKNYEKSISQISTNIVEIEQFLEAKGRMDLQVYLYLLQLNVKLPFLISSQIRDYETWQKWFPKSNKYIEYNDEATWRTKLLQKAARAKQYWFLRLYYFFVIKVVYGIIFR